jgi:hypothetical protein
MNIKFLIHYFILNYIYYLKKIIEKLIKKK